MADVIFSRVLEPIFKEDNFLYIEDVDHRFERKYIGYTGSRRLILCGVYNVFTSGGDGNYTIKKIRKKYAQ